MNYLYEKISWKSCTDEHFNSYNQNLVCLVTELLNRDLSNVDHFYEDLSTAIKTADVVLPRVKYKKHVKPFWSNSLKESRNSVMTARAKWLKMGSPRCPNNVFYRQYKITKCRYRREQRKAVWEFERKEFDDIADLSELDHGRFWRLLNNRVRRKKRKQKTVILEKDGGVFTDPQTIADLWANYYEKLATPSEHEHQKEMGNRVSEILTNSEGTYEYTFNSPITEEEIITVVKTLPNGKSPCIDGITYEHIKYGGEIIVKILLKFYNFIIETEEIPNFFKLAVKIPIPKGY